MKRRDSQVFIFEIVDGAYDMQTEVGSLSEADRWICKHGADGSVYRAARVWPAVRVTSTTITKNEVEVL
jgi:hypothetical protein